MGNIYIFARFIELYRLNWINLIFVKWGGQNFKFLTENISLDSWNEKV